MNQRTHQFIEGNKISKRLLLPIAYCLLPTLFCLLSVVCSAQLNFNFTEGKFLIKGKVTDIQTKNIIGFANIRVNGTSKGVTCDADGNFTFYVYKTDTLKFSSTGYLNKIIHVYDLDSSKLYTLDIQLMHDFIKLKEVTIYPFHDLDEFKKAFVEGKDLNKISIAGIAAPKYGTKIPKAKFTNPVSFLYEHLKRKRSSADPDFKP